MVWTQLDLQSIQHREYIGHLCISFQLKFDYGTATKISLCREFGKDCFRIECFITNLVKIPAQCALVQLKSDRAIQTALPKEPYAEKFEKLLDRRRKYKVGKFCEYFDQKIVRIFTSSIQQCNLWTSMSRSNSMKLPEKNLSFKTKCCSHACFALWRRHQPCK